MKLNKNHTLKILIGHRGVGKTSLLYRLKCYFPQDQFFDLDQSVADSHGPIDKIFKEKGEEHFRKLELEFFQKLFKDLSIKNYSPVWISIGAGAHLEQLMELVTQSAFLNLHEVIWISRITDSDGRIFLNRPRLESSLSPLEDFFKRKSSRDQQYLKFAHWIYHLPEGLDRPNEYEKNIFQKVYHHVRAVITLLPEHRKSEKVWSSFLERFFKNPEISFEVRTDFWSWPEIENILSHIPGDRILFSIRSLDFKLVSRMSAFWKIDWSMELGAVPQEILDLCKEKIIYSFHETETILKNSDLLKLNKNLQLKVSPMIDDWQELEFWMNWQNACPDMRSFHPRSQSGKWKWFRLYQWHRQNLNFLKDFSGSAVDQPSLLEILQIPPQESSNFAAVLGFPVCHSRSPQEHQNFFHSLGRQFFAIEISKEDFSLAMPILQKMGLDFAAVTSPLKELACKLVGQLTSEASGLSSVNTLYWNKDKSIWYGHNTDIVGFEFQMKHLLPHFSGHPKIAIWGGGGTLAMLQKVLPTAVLYSSSQGTPRDAHQEIINFSPECIIWAAPNSKNTQWPPSAWTPQWVIDLNYKEDSMGIEYAMIARCHYSSGLTMFKKQAEEQQKYWSVQNVSK